MPVDPARAEAIFLAADPAARARLLDETGAGDAELRRRVETLLRAHDHPDSLLDRPAVGGPAAADDARTLDDAGEAGESLAFLSPPQRAGSLGRIGHYEVLEVLGRGGFGVVFRGHVDALRAEAVTTAADRLRSGMTAAADALTACRAIPHAGLTRPSPTSWGRTGTRASRKPTLASRYDGASHSRNPARH